MKKIIVARNLLSQFFSFHGPLIRNQDGGKSYPEAPHLPPGTFDDWTGEKALDKQGYSKHVFLNATYLTFTDIVYRLKQSKGKQHWHLHHEVFIDCCGPDGPAGSGKNALFLKYVICSRFKLESFNNFKVDVVEMAVK